MAIDELMDGQALRQMIKTLSLCLDRRDLDWSCTFRLYWMFKQILNERVARAKEAWRKIRYRIWRLVRQRKRLIAFASSYDVLIPRTIPLEIVRHIFSYLTIEDLLLYADHVKQSWKKASEKSKVKQLKRKKTSTHIFETS